MDSRNREVERTGVAQGGLGPVRELRNLQASGSASLAELREFLASLKGRKPQEVIGIVSASLLIQSMVISLFATAGILAVFTVGPYLIYGPPQARKPTPAKATPETAQAAESAPTESSPLTAAATPAPAASDAPGVPDAARAAQVMGLDETKAADPKQNPLDRPDLDKLLDGVDN
jgi:hypothetical protein